MIKYNIIVVYSDYKCEIVKTFMNHENAIEYLMCLTDRNYKGEKESNFKVYVENKNVITVNTIGYFSKCFYAKYYIIKHEDNLEEKPQEEEEDHY